MNRLPAIATGAACLLTGLIGLHGEMHPNPRQAKATADLGGGERYLTFVSTDKPIYRPGEKLFVRAMVLQAASHTPTSQVSNPMVEITGPKGDVVASGMTQLTDATAGFSWEIPAAMPGGEYSIRVTHPGTGHAPGIRKFDIRAFRAPRLKSQIVFVRDGYGPGDSVSASVHVDRAEGGVPANAKVTVVARVDGVEIHRAPTSIDAQGNASASFKLPAAIARGEGTLAFLIEDGGVIETASKTLPILLQTLDLTLYPEGGDLVAGVPNRVYLEAFTPARKPADLKGVIIDGNGADVASITTAHEGRGRFEFTPAKGQKYTLKITEPAGIKTTYPLPAVKDTGAVLSAVDDITPAGKPVRLKIAGAAPGVVRITLSKQEVEVANSIVRIVAEPARSDPPTALIGKAFEVALTPPDSADGVLVATLWDDKNNPLAERLIYRQPAKTVKVEVKPDQSTYTPGQPVKLTVITTDDSGKPVSAVVGVSVTDDAVLEMIEKREQAPRLPAMVLLEADVKDLADAQVYLDPANPKAPLATDLLLGTQGWRRFAFVKPIDFISQNGDAARRVLAMRVVTALETTSIFAGFDDRIPKSMAAMPPNPAVPRAANEPMKNGHAVGKDEPADAPRNEGAPVAQLKQKPAFGADREGDELRGPQAAVELAKALETKEKRDAMGDLMGRREAGGKARQAARNDFIAIREFAHAVRPNRQPNDRSDFAETLYFNAGVKTDAATGQATLSFATSDAVTAFRVNADAIHATGALGASSSTIQSIKPFYLEAKMPLEVTQGDRIELPLTLVNGTTDPLEGATFTIPEVKSFSDWSFSNKPVMMNPGERLRKILAFTVGDATGDFDVAITATAGAYSDKVTRKLRVKPRGFPIEFAKGGLLGPNPANANGATATYTIEIPADLVAGSITSDLAIYPTPLANLTQALEALIRSPSGCFEQTSSTTYPLVMAQQYFMSHQGVDPKLIERSRKQLDDGYGRLVGFECKTTKGFEWFGADPGHDALSAYGLLQFTDMAAVREVDPKMLDRTRAFVLGLRDGKGAFKRLTHTLHTWIAEPECNNAYVTWALLECGTSPKELTKEIDWIKQNIAKSSNSYAIALGANVLAIAGDHEGANAFLKKLAAKQNKEGLIEGATTSIIGSGGDALNIETTSLATLGFLRYPDFAGNVEHSMKWIAETCKAGRFGSTQSTILALRAIVTYDKARARPKAPGSVLVMVDGKQMGSVIAFDEKTTGAIKLQDISEMLSPGQHTVAVTMTAGSEMPYSLAVRYNTLKPNSSEECKLTLSTTLRDAKIGEGNITEAVATIVNKSAETIPTPIAIIGIPGGLEVRHDQLKELVKSGKIDAYEVIGREVVLYWRAMKPDDQREIPLSLTASIPGTYTAPASRSYLYYTDEHKVWSNPLKVEIAPK